MAERVRVDLVDDIDQSDAAEKVFFALDGKDYEIDLSAAHARALREALAVYVAHGRPVSRKGRGAGAARRATRSGGPSACDIRDWAKSKGMTVNERGRIPAEIRDAYDAAH
ncbi:MAG: Lsr2 family protein [Marmoricola sp.]